RCVEETHTNIDIPVIDVTIESDFPEGAVVTGVFQVADNPDFTNAVEIPITSKEIDSNAATKADDEGEDAITAPEPETPEVTPAAPRKLQGVIEGNLWEDAFVTFYKYNPAPHDNYYRYILYTQIGSQVTELSGDYTDGYKIMVTPVDQQFPISDEYVIFGKYIGGGDLEHAVTMKHSDTHKYDDPNYSYVVEVAANQVNDFTWEVAGADENDNNVYGVVDPAATTGQLRLITDGGVPGQIALEGPWTIEVNMLKKTYSIKLAAKSLYVYGPAGDISKSMQLATDNFTNYYGFGCIKESFRLSTDNKLDSGLKYGAGEAEGTLSVGDKDVNAIKVSGAKANTLFYINADIVKMTYDVTKITTLGVVGDFTKWADDKDVALKANSARNKYTGEVTVDAAGGFKFRCNGSWDINLGGSLDNLTFGGDNLQFPEAGTYSITLDLSTLPYTATVVKK
ncbi:MAG: hypothetical protein K2H86_00265, partial [Muribaculaceae bacterium]|nr:hypothetical protein [Muribaculaceae bacterium]